jgi:hypothetical protein
MIKKSDKHRLLYKKRIHKKSPQKYIKKGKQHNQNINLENTHIKIKIKIK